MKPMNRFAIPVVAVALTALVPVALAANDSRLAPANEAKVSEAQARETALAKVPHGAVKSSELENEHGRLIWSFDISKPSSENITEVNVDAKTGRIVAVRNETSAIEAREAKAEKAKE